MSDVIKLRGKVKVSKMDEAAEAELNQQYAPQKIDLGPSREEELEQQYQYGFNEGYEAAQKELNEQFEQALIKRTEEFYAILSGFEQKLVEYDQSYSEIVLQVAGKIAGAIVRREVTLDSSVEENLRACVQKIAGSTEVTIKLNPVDYEMLFNAGKTGFIEKSFNKVKFEVTDKIDKGGCFLETELGNVDGRIETQLDEIMKELQYSIENHG